MIEILKNQEIIKTKKEDLILYPPKNSPWNPRYCTGPSLRGHIVNTHLSPITLAQFGVPIYDCKLAIYRGFSLDWVTQRATELIEEPIGNKQQNYSHSASFGFPNGLHPEYRPSNYLTALTQTLIFLESLGQIVDWNHIKQVVPNLDDIDFVQLRDSGDSMFSPDRFRF